MPETTDVALPKSHTPSFPDRCVSCGVERPEATYRAATNAIGWWTFTLRSPSKSKRDRRISKTL